MKFIVDTSIWEHGEYIVTIRPDFEPTWRMHPLGSTMDKKEAKFVEDWLRCALPDLWKIFTNVYEDEHSNIQTPTSNP